MKIINNPSQKEWKALCERNIPDDSEIEKSVKDIISNVKAYGDSALRHYAKTFDGFTGDSFELTAEEIEAAASTVAPEIAEVISKAADNIKAFHKAQLPAEIEVETTAGVRCVQKAVPIRKVGLYIPGGRAPLFSTVLMLAIPAKIAGCKEIVLCTPDN